MISDDGDGGENGENGKNGENGDNRDNGENGDNRDNGDNGDMLDIMWFLQCFTNPSVLMLVIGSSSSRHITNSMVTFHCLPFWVNLKALRCHFVSPKSQPRLQAHEYLVKDPELGELPSQKFDS